MATLGRRLFLRTLAMLAGLAALPGTLRAFVLKTFTTRTVESGEQNAFRFDPADGFVRYATRQEPYFLVVDGLVDQPLRLSYAELRGLPQTAQISDFHCVEGWSVLDVRWSGVRFAEIVALARPKAGATHAVFHALGWTLPPVDGQDHYVESLPLQGLLDPRLAYLLALDLDGSPLSHDRGAPIRVVCPFDLGYKGTKFVARIEFTDRPVSGWWTLANPAYPVDAPVNDGRLRRPDPRAKPSGKG